MTPELREIANKVEAGRRLSEADGVALFRSDDLFTLAELANLVRERKHGDRCYYNVNVHLNPTNVCVYRCNFCAFRSDLKAPKAYVMSDAEIRDRADEAHARGVTEMHIVGGLHHLQDYDWYCRILRIIKEAHPEIHLKAYTAVEIEWFTRISKLS